MPTEWLSCQTNHFPTARIRPKQTAMVVMRRVIRAESSSGKRPGRPRRSGISASWEMSDSIGIISGGCYSITLNEASLIYGVTEVYFSVATPQ